MIGQYIVGELPSVRARNASLVSIIVWVDCFGPVAALVTASMVSLRKMCKPINVPRGSYFALWNCIAAYDSVLELPPSVSFFFSQAENGLNYIHWESLYPRFETVLYF